MRERQALARDGSKAGPRRMGVRGLAMSAAFAAAGWGRPGHALSVLLYHRIRADRDPLFAEDLDAREFAEQLDWVSRYFRVLPLSDAIGLLGSGKLPARALAITFDDGYADNATVAWPLLRSRGLPATLFVATGFLEGGRMWNDSVIEAVRGVPQGVLDLGTIGLGAHVISDETSRRAAILSLLKALKYLPTAERGERVNELVRIVGVQLPNDLMLSRHTLRRLALDGMEVGAHTINHPILAGMDDDSARREIAGSREELESLLRQPVRLFAYPNGKPNRDYSSATVRLVRSLGFDAAVSTSWGTARAGDDVFQLPRFTPWDRSQLRFGVRMALNLRHAVERADEAGGRSSRTVA